MIPKIINQNFQDDHNEEHNPHNQNDQNDEITKTIKIAQR